MDASIRLRDTWVSFLGFTGLQVKPISADTDPNLGAVKIMSVLLIHLTPRSLRRQDFSASEKHSHILGFLLASEKHPLLRFD